MEWVQCFNIFVAVFHSSQPDRTPDLIGYQNLIMQTSKLGQEGRWILYDRRFRLKASALRLQHWSTIDITVWHMAFPELSPRSVPILQRGAYRPPQRTTTTNRPICLDWNDTHNAQCPHCDCKFDHICYCCAHNYHIRDKDPKAMFCPNKPQQPQPFMSKPKAF